MSEEFPSPLLSSTLRLLLDAERLAELRAAPRLYPPYIVRDTRIVRDRTNDDGATS